MAPVLAALLLCSSSTVNAAPMRSGCRVDDQDPTCYISRLDHETITLDEHGYGGNIIL